MNLRFLIAEAISNAGTGIGFSVLGLLLAKSGEAQALALLGALGYLAQPLGLYTGLLVDRVSPRKLVLMAKLGEGFVWGVMFAFAHSAYAMLGLAFAAIVFHDLAHNALNAVLTRSYREKLVEQTARFQNAWLSGSLAGTASGPGLHELIGRNTYGLVAFLLLAGAVLLATWSLWGRVGGPAPMDRGNRGGFLEGFRIISKERTLRSFVGLGLLVVFAFSFSRALDPMIALELKVPPELLGVFLVAASLGQISGNAIGARLGAARSLTFGLGLASAGCLALAFSPHPYALITQFVRLGGFTLALLGLRAFRQWCMPRASLGRTLASLNILNGAAGVAGAAAAGVVGKFEPLFTLPVAALLVACTLAWMVFIQPHGVFGRLKKNSAKRFEAGFRKPTASASSRCQPERFPARLLETPRADDRAPLRSCPARIEDNARPDRKRRGSDRITGEWKGGVDEYRLPGWKVRPRGVRGGIREQHGVHRPGLPPGPGRGSFYGGAF